MKRSTLTVQTTWKSNKR